MAKSGVSMTAAGCEEGVAKDCHRTIETERLSVSKTGSCRAPESSIAVSLPRPVVDMGETIRVVSRFRPLNERERALEKHGALPPRFSEDGRTVCIGPDEGTGTYSMDAVIPPSATQGDLYAHVQGIVEAVLQGYNGTILAYGQTGSGKTYSIMGDAKSNEEAGVLPRAIQQIFDTVLADTSGTEFGISCTYMEIYKEVVRDLLQPAATGPGMKASSLAIRESAAKGIYVEGLTEVFVMNEGDIEEVLTCGNANRMVGSTLMNAQSSRSHAVLTISLQQKLPDGSVMTSKLNVADLAGSEKVSKTGASGGTLEEAKKINASLSALCLVISALADSKPHVPYRNSKLTRILQESLGGNSKTVLLVACSPAADNASETHSSLRFAMRAKTVKNVAVVNTVLSPEQLQRAVDELKRELKRARAAAAKCTCGAAHRVGNANDAWLGEGERGGAAGRCDVVVRDDGRADATSMAEVSRLSSRLEAAEQQLAAAQAEAEEEAAAARGLAETLARQKEETELLHDTLERFQVLHGVAPMRSRDSREGIEQLRRSLVEVEAMALQQDMCEMDDADADAALLSRMRTQLAEQHRRLRELEPVAAEVAAARAEADAAREETAQLRRQLQQMAESKLQQISSKSRRSICPTPAMLSLCTRTGGAASALLPEQSFRERESFGQHMLRRQSIMPSRDLAHDSSSELEVERSRCRALERTVSRLREQLTSAGLADEQGGSEARRSSCCGLDRAGSKLHGLRSIPMPEDEAVVWYDAQESPLKSTAMSSSGASEVPDGALKPRWSGVGPSGDPRAVSALCEEDAQSASDKTGSLDGLHRSCSSAAAAESTHSHDNLSPPPPPPSVSPPTGSPPSSPSTSPPPSHSTPPPPPPSPPPPPPALPPAASSLSPPSFVLPSTIQQHQEPLPSQQCTRVESPQVARPVLIHGAEPFAPMQDEATLFQDQLRLQMPQEDVVVPPLFQKDESMPPLPQEAPPPPPQEAPPQEAPPQEAPPQEAPPQEAPPQEAPPPPPSADEPEGVVDAVAGTDAALNIGWVSRSRRSQRSFSTRKLSKAFGQNEHAVPAAIPEFVSETVPLGQPTIPESPSAIRTSLVAALGAGIQQPETKGAPGIGSPLASPLPATSLVEEPACPTPPPPPPPPPPLEGTIKEGLRPDGTALASATASKPRAPVDRPSALSTKPTKGRRACDSENLNPQRKRKAQAIN